jgi:hypothetical protein
LFWGCFAGVKDVMRKLLLLCGLVAWSVVVTIIASVYLYTREPTGWTCEGMAFNFRTPAMQRKWLQLNCDEKLVVTATETSALSRGRAGHERLHRKTASSAHAAAPVPGTPAADKPGAGITPRPVIAICVSVGTPSAASTTSAYGQPRAAKRLHNSASNATNVLLTLPLASLLKSLGDTAESGYDYWAYVVYDAGDELYDDGGSGVASSGAIDAWFSTAVVAPLAERGITAALAVVRFRNRLARVGAAENFILRAAYDDGADFLFSVRDCTLFQTLWAGTLVSALRSMTPPFVGLVRPVSVAADLDNWAEVMVHRTHIDVFHSFVPPSIVGWYVQLYTCIDALIDALRGFID